MTTILQKETIAHWNQLKDMTYDFIDRVKDKDLQKKLPFPTSQTLGNQFFCMVGTVESTITYIQAGEWKSWKCSVKDEEKADKSEYIKKMRRADEVLIKLLKEVDLLKAQKDGLTPLMKYMILAEHESHHQGQIINFIFAHDLPIPESWAEKWALKK